MKYEVFAFDDVADAMKKVRNHKKLGRKRSIRWTGPDNLHYSISASSPSPSWHLSKEGLDYHAERGRNLDDVMGMIMFQIGYHNGVVIESKTTELYARMVDAYQSHFKAKN